MPPSGRTGRLALLPALLLGAAESRAQVSDDSACAFAPAAQTERALRALARAEHWLDLHHATATLALLCPAAPARAQWRLWDGLALFRLDDRLRAVEQLTTLRAELGTDELRLQADLILAWLYHRSEDGQAFAAVVARLPETVRWRARALDAHASPGRLAALLPRELAPGEAAELLRLSREYEAAGRSRRPWLAGTLSAVLPGAGQVYAGSWQAAAVAFALNAVFIGATVELARERLWWSASAMGLGASVFYVGSILNAADLARRHGALRAEAAREALEQALVPEAYPGAATRD